VFTTDIPIIYLAQINTVSASKKHSAVTSKARQKKTVNVTGQLYKNNTGNVQMT